MSDKGKVEWPNYEHALLVGVGDLMTRWKASLQKQSQEDHDSFISDGFYPNYTRQRCRILFIGREAYGDGGWDYIETFIPHYQGKTPLKERGGWFHHRLLWIAWGLLKRVPSWGELPELPELFPHFGKPESEGGFSFAFMNANKLPNQESTRMRWDSLDQFVAHSQAFILEEIALLHPDVVISMNMNDRESYRALGFHYDEHADAGGNVAIHHFPDGTPFLDTYHFSSSKSPDANIYAPLVQALQNPLVNLW